MRSPRKERGSKLMGRKRTPGLIQRKGVWHINKRICGQLICKSTGTQDLEKAELFLARIIEELRQSTIYGVRPERTFRQAGVKHLNESVKVTLKEDVRHLRKLDPFVGDLPLQAVHMGSLQPFIENLKKYGNSNRTINYALQITRHILNKASGEWLDENGLTWLHAAPKIKLLPLDDAREPYPISWEEQTKLLDELPEHIRTMALFAVNTGCRDKEITGLKWEYEVDILEMQTSVFIIPAQKVKNRTNRVVVLNDVAKSIIETQRGKDPEHVFVYKGKPIDRVGTSSWKRARVRAGLAHVRVHDLRHTFGRRLRAAGVRFEDIQDLLGHKSGRITTHYSGPELSNLIEAANKICENNSRPSPSLVILKRKVR